MNHKSPSEFFLSFEGVDSKSCGVDVMNEKLEVLAWSWNSTNYNTLNSSGRSAHKDPHMNSFSITKWQGLESAYLAKLVSEGAPIGKVILECQTESLDSRYELSQVKILNLYCGGSSGESRLTENITIHNRVAR